MRLYSAKRNSAGLLDDIRLKEGNDKLKTYFRSIASNDIEKAISLVNDDKINFPTLFILQPEIMKHDLTQSLNRRIQHSLDIASRISARNTPDPERLIIDYRDVNYSALKWILRTGYLEDDINEHYDVIMDTAAAILAVSYRDKDCIQYIEELIYNRNRKNSYIYDLVWAFFEASDADSLVMMAKRLYSDNRKDTILVKKLLNFIPCVNDSNIDDNLEKYYRAVSWINRNRNYLYFTCESCQQTPNPRRYAISMEAKYLQKYAAVFCRNFSGILTDLENNLLENFQKQDHNTRLLLSEYSHDLFHSSQYWWEKWIHTSIEEQIAIAQKFKR